MRFLMGVAKLKYFETENSLMRVKVISLFLASTIGLFYFSNRNKKTTQLREKKYVYSKR